MRMQRDSITTSNLYMSQDVTLGDSYKKPTLANKHVMHLSVENRKN